MATRSILSILATLPSGAEGAPLQAHELAAYLAKYSNAGADKDRESRHALREELYRDGGVQHMYGLIDRIFRDPKVRELRRQFVPQARFTNPLRRIVHALSTVYTEPARRHVDGAENDAVYQRVLEAVRMDERMLEAGRLANLHRALLIGFRVRELPDGTREPVIEIASPATARPVLHPNDPSVAVGWLVRTSYRSARETGPAWTLWSDHESIQLTEEMQPLVETYQAHALGVCPWVPITFGASVWSAHCDGEDLVAAHLMTWFANVLLLKETKSATTSTVLQGDSTRLARGQAMESEGMLEVPEGTSVTTVDPSMDLEMFRDTANHVVRSCGMNYGLPPAVLEHQGAQSAEARELMLIPLKEMRRQQQLPLRRFEERFARVMSAILKIDLPDMAFDASSFHIEFAETSTPLDPVKQFDLFEKLRAAGLTNTVDFLAEVLRPGLTPEQAWRQIQANILVETQRNVAMRPLAAVAGSLAGGPSPKAPQNKDKAKDDEAQDDDDDDEEEVA